MEIDTGNWNINVSTVPLIFGDCIIRWTVSTGVKITTKRIYKCTCIQPIFTMEFIRAKGTTLAMLLITDLSFHNFTFYQKMKSLWLRWMTPQTHSFIHSHWWCLNNKRVQMMYWFTLDSVRNCFYLWYKPLWVKESGSLLLNFVFNVGKPSPHL